MQVQTLPHIARNGEVSLLWLSPPLPTPRDLQGLGVDVDVDVAAESSLTDGPLSESLLVGSLGAPAARGGCETVELRVRKTTF